MRQRLAKLERTAMALGARPCPHCRGAPVAVVHEEYENDPHGPGYRRTGRRFVEEEYVRLPEGEDDECRCRHCARPQPYCSSWGLPGWVRGSRGHDRSAVPVAAGRARHCRPSGRGVRDYAAGVRDPAKGRSPRVRATDARTGGAVYLPTSLPR